VGGGGGKLSRGAVESGPWTERWAAAAAMDKDSGGAISCLAELRLLTREVAAGLRGNFPGERVSAQVKPLEHFALC
jgi:hypothetical protein